MSVWSQISDFLGIGGNSATSQAVASTNVQVNPKITSLNVIDTKALADVFDKGIQSFEIIQATDIARQDARAAQALSFAQAQAQIEADTRAQAADEVAAKKKQFKKYIVPALAVAATFWKKG